MVAPGASVSAGQSVMELETDKAVVEVPSSVSGTVQEIRVKEGDKIKVGQVIFTVDGAEAKAPPGASRTSATAPGVLIAFNVGAAGVAPCGACGRRFGTCSRRGCFDHIRSRRIQTSRTGRKHLARGSGSFDDRARHQGFGRPAGDGD